MACPSRALVFASLASAVSALHDWDSGDHWFEPHGHSLSLWIAAAIVAVIVLFMVAVCMFSEHGRHHPYNRHLYSDDPHYPGDGASWKVEHGKNGKSKYKHKHSKFHHHATPYPSAWGYGAVMGPPSFVPKY